MPKLIPDFLQCPVPGFRGRADFPLEFVAVGQNPYIYHLLYDLSEFKLAVFEGFRGIELCLCRMRNACAERVGIETAIRGYCGFWGDRGSDLLDNLRYKPKFRIKKSVSLPV